MTTPKATDDSIKQEQEQLKKLIGDVVKERDELRIKLSFNASFIEGLLIGIDKTVKERDDLLEKLNELKKERDELAANLKILITAFGQIKVIVDRSYMK